MPGRFRRPAQRGPTRHTPIEWLDRLNEVVGHMSAAAHTTSLVDTIIGGTTYAVGAVSVTLYVVDEADDNLVLLGTNIDNADFERRWGLLPLTADAPVCEALRSRDQVRTAGRAELRRRYPQASFGKGVSTLICVPLIAGDRDVGVLSLHFEDIREHDVGHRAALSLFSASCAQALQRVRATERLTKTARQLTFLQQAGNELAGTLDYPTTLQNVADLAVPALADWCTVHILDDDQLRAVAVAHSRPDDAAMAQYYREHDHRSLSADSDDLTRVVRSGVSQLITSISDESIVEYTTDGRSLEFARGLGLRSAVLVPLVARGNVVGALTMATSLSGRVFGSADLDLAERLAAQAAVAIDNSQLYSQTREVAVQLQSAVHLHSSFDIPGWDIGVYQRASGRTELGGDFYDAVELSSGRILVLIADVMGRGVGAAATLVSTLSALRTLVALDPDPGVVVSRLYDSYEFNHAQKLITVAVALLDPQADDVVVANAGHLPPMIVTDTSAYLDGESPVSPPLGAHIAPHPSRRVLFPPGATLVLYTDGLVERRGEDLDLGLDRITDTAASAPIRGLPDWLTTLCDEVRDPLRDDDATAIAVRRR